MEDAKVYELQTLVLYFLDKSIDEPGIDLAYAALTELVRRANHEEQLPIREDGTVLRALPRNITQKEIQKVTKSFDPTEETESELE